MVGTDAGQILWHSGDGKGNFSTAQIVTSVSGAQFRSVATADFDQDGNLDVVASNFQSNNLGFVAIYFGPTFTRNFTVASGLSAAAGLTVGDFNHDLLIDIFTAVRDTSAVIVYRNNRIDFPAVLRLVAGRPLGVDSADVNKDDNIDLFAALREGGLMWYENDGSSFTEHLIANVPDPRSIRMEDLNGDGQVDAIATIFGSRQLSYFSLLPDGSWSRTDVATVDSPVWAEGCDVNDDGKNDILLATQGTTNATIAWYENENNDGVFAVRLLSAVRDGRMVKCYDIDGDGDQDIVWTALTDPFNAVTVMISDCCR